MQVIVLMISFVVAAGALVGVVFLVVGDVVGAPFVPTDEKLLEKTFAKIKLGREGVFMDLGSGDGLIVRWVAKKYGCRSIGFEIHPMLVLWSRLLAIKDGLDAVEFRAENFWKADIGTADCVYCYLTPASMEKMGKKLERQGKNGLVVISRGFEIDGWRDKVLERKEVSGKRVYVYLRDSHKTSRGAALKIEE